MVTNVQIWGYRPHQSVAHRLPIDFIRQHLKLTITVSQTLVQDVRYCQDLCKKFNTILVVVTKLWARRPIQANNRRRWHLVNRKRPGIGHFWESEVPALILVQRTVRHDY